MKAFFDFGRVSGWRLKTIIVLLTTLAAAATGCSKANTPAPTVAQPQKSADATPSTPSATLTASTTMSSQPAAPAVSDNTKQTLQSLNRALMQWMIRNRRHPQSFEEFANSANFHIPNPPAGKKYALDGRGFIVLVENQ